MTPMSATAPDTAAPPVVKQAPVVEISGLWSVFHTAGVDVVVHKDLNLTVPHGEMLAIVGGSGSGKTVLLRQILGLQTPSRGSVTVLEVTTEAVVPCPRLSVLGLTRSP